MQLEFTFEDKEFMAQRGSEPAQVEQQFANFEMGFPCADIDRPATVDDGILRLDEEEVAALEAEYPYAIEGKKIEKFVPASGAASRMLKDLYALLNENLDDKQQELAKTFLATLPRYPFYEALKKAMADKQLDLDAEIPKGNFRLIIQYLLEKEGLNYGNLPKGLLLFHRYDNEIRTAIEEHFVEAALYATSGTDAYLHFTVSEHHLELFKAKVAEIQPVYEERFGVKYHVTFSMQAASTDTLAATEDNKPFRDENGKLLFRPGGHGALIYNVNNRDADILFVKNIDNVTKDQNIAPTVIYKKVLAAYLSQLQSIQFQYLKILEAGEVDPMTLCEIMDFAESKLMISLDEQPTTEELYELMNRPVRLCGMVKNEGEPGGGPFWVRDTEGNCSLQIVESSQIDKNDPEKLAIMAKATHFNPVDMVCAIKNYKGEKFDLLQYVDPNTGFISSKSYNGKTLKAMELPGLWNGAMANWITVFVEVPLATFNPVKNVFDLLKRN